MPVVKSPHRDSCQDEYLETPVKSENDKKEYRVIRLSNGLEALLISSEKALGTFQNKNDKNFKNKTAFGLCVGVGNFSDPPEMPGIGYFFEHMIFGEFQEQSKETNLNSFDNNCITNTLMNKEHTIFYADIEEDNLFVTLYNYAQFFVKPMMTKDEFLQKKETIKKEFQLALKQVNKTGYDQLFSSLAQTGHPANKFTGDHLIKLYDNIDYNKLYDVLHKFKERHYSAHRMKLAIQSGLSLNTLEKFIKACFADVPTNGLPPDDFAEFKDVAPFDTPAFRKIYKVWFTESFTQLKITWNMPSFIDFYKSKPCKYISWFMSYEGKGSLTSYLRKNIWIPMISSHDALQCEFNHSSMYSFIRLTIQLNHEGYKHLEEVLDAIFSFINLLKRKGPQKEIYDEISINEKIGFRFIDENQPLIYVKELCKNMHLFPLCDYIIGNQLYLEYNSEAIQNCLNYLIPESTNIMIFKNDFNSFELNKVDPWWHTKYIDIEIPKEWIERWNSIEPLPDFHLPFPNIFLSTDFSLVPLPTEVPKYPVKIYSDHISEIWYRPDPTFRLPKCYINLRFISPLTFHSSKNEALMTMYSTLLRLLLNEELFSALEAGFEYGISNCDEGFLLTLCGFRNLPMLLAYLAIIINDYPNHVTKDLFEVIKKELLHTYNNIIMKPDKFADEIVVSILQLIHYSWIDVHNALLNITFKEFQDFAKSFNDYLYIQCLVQGNMTKVNAIKTIQHFIRTINCDSLHSTTIQQNRIIQIPLGASYYKLKNINKFDRNSIVTNFYEAGIMSIELSALLELIIFIMEQKLDEWLPVDNIFENVSCESKNINGILGYSLTICAQKDKYTTEYMDQLIEKFLKWFKENFLEELVEKKLDYFKESLINHKQRYITYIKNLEEEVTRNWTEIVTCRYMFDRHENEILALKKIKVNELRKWFANHTSNGNNFRKLSVHIVGTNANEAQYVALEYIINQQYKEVKTHYITKVEDYKKKLYMYPVTK